MVTADGYLAALEMGVDRHLEAVKSTLFDGRMVTADGGLAALEKGGG